MSAPLIIDSFAGGGGASTGIEMALGRSPDYAINHSAAALALHQANHPDTIHLDSNIWIAISGRWIRPSWCRAALSACCGPARIASISARPRAAHRAIAISAIWLGSLSTGPRR